MSNQPLPSFQPLPSLQPLPSFQSMVDTFKQMKASFGLHYPSKHSVLQALSAALEKCDSKDLRIIAFQLDIDHKQMSDIKLRLEIQKQIFYKLYNASIHAWNVTVTSGVTVIIILLIQKLIKYTTLDGSLLSPLNNLLSVAYMTIGSVALAGVFFRWLQSKNLRNKVLRLLERIKSGTLRQGHSQKPHQPIDNNIKIEKRLSMKRSLSKRSPAKRLSMKRSLSKRSPAKRLSMKRSLSKRSPAKRFSLKPLSQKRSSPKPSSSKRPLAKPLSSKRSSAKPSSSKRS